MKLNKHVWKSVSQASLKIDPSVPAVTVRATTNDKLKKAEVAERPGAGCVRTSYVPGRASAAQWTGGLPE